MKVGGAVMGFASDCFGLAYERLGHRCQNLGAESHVVRGTESQNDDGGKVYDENEFWPVMKVQTGTPKYQQSCYGLFGREPYLGQWVPYDYARHLYSHLPQRKDLEAEKL